MKRQTKRLTDSDPADFLLEYESTEVRIPDPTSAMKAYNVVNITVSTFFYSKKRSERSEVRGEK